MPSWPPNPFRRLRLYVLARYVQNDIQDLLLLHRQELPRIAASLEKIAQSLHKPQPTGEGHAMAYTPNPEDFVTWEEEERQRQEATERIEFPDEPEPEEPREPQRVEPGGPGYGW